MRTIFHISDVHFGPPHLPRVSQGVLEFVERHRPSVVVLSGDLTQRARPEQFRAAREFVDRIPVPVLVVPGNHDVPLYRVWERAFDPFGAYRRWFSEELEPIYRDDELLIVGINTAFNWTFKEGRIKLSRLLEVGKLLEDTPETVLKVVVAHHHLIPPPNFGTQRVLSNAYEAIDLFSSVGVDLILSGHLHQAYIGNSEEFYPKGRPPVVILHSGTTTSNRGRAGERERNTCNWIRADDRSMVVSHYRWHRDMERFAEHSRHWYPRQELAPYTLEGVEGSDGGGAGSRVEGDDRTIRYNPSATVAGKPGRDISMEDWEIVRVVSNEEEATIAAGFLRSNGIPAEVESLAISELPVTVGGDMDEVRLLVPRDRLSEALTLLDERDAAPSAPEPGSAPAEPGPAVAEPSPVEPE